MRISRVADLRRDEDLWIVSETPWLGLLCDRGDVGSRLTFHFLLDSFLARANDLIMALTPTLVSQS
jgi:hypothetical protein